jgi:DNA-directed RNA polymerase specialized sigma subunit
MKGMVAGMQYTLDYLASFELHDDFMRNHSHYAKLKRELSLNNSRSIRNTSGRSRPLFQEFLRAIAKDDTRTKLDSLEITPDHPIHDFLDFTINQKKDYAISHWNGEKFIEQTNNAIEKLPQRQFEVVRQYFGFECSPKTLEEIGKALKPEITRQAVQQHKEAALSSIRQELLAQGQGQ